MEPSQGSLGGALADEGYEIARLADGVFIGEWRRARTVPTKPSLVA